MSETDVKDSISHEYTVEEVNGNHIVGELHIRVLNNPEDNTSYNKLLEENSDSIFVIESDPSQSNTFQNNPNTFMNMTLTYVRKKDLPLETMDDETMRYNRFGVWETAGSDLTQEDFDLINSLYFPYSQPKVPPIELLNMIQNSNLQDSRKQIYYNGILKYIGIFKDEKAYEKLESVKNLALSFIRYDSICREIYYQKKIAKIMEENPNKKIFAVFGNSHKKGIAQTLKEKEYTTPLPSSKELKDMIQELITTI